MSKRSEWFLPAQALLAILCVAVVFCSGCAVGVAGKWRMVKALPNRDVFSMTDVQFNSDGSYAATITLEGVTRREEGAYSFNGFKMLLRPQAGGVREFDAMLVAGELELKRGPRAVVLRKQ